MSKIKGKNHNSKKNESSKDEKRTKKVAFDRM